tara:strand:- start:5854 stop:7395 length:1542 start_codon:yes stop_codon:yes gene_type:complete
MPEEDHEKDHIDQQQVIDFLRDPASHGDHPVEHIETHISHVFLVGEKAYKLKKHLKNEFLDYSTLSLREKYCRREVDINRRLTPELYRGCMAVLRERGGFILKPDQQLTETDRAVEWLVEMTRFKDEEVMSHMAAQGPLSLDLIDQLAAVMARFHNSLPADPRYGGARAMHKVRGDILSGLARQTDRLFNDSELQQWGKKLTQCYDDIGAHLDQRRAAGRVRACHGDLHLGNLCCLEGRVAPFDAIEFNPALSHIDVFYELAFPVMDLMYFGQKTQAAYLLNRYLEQTADYDGLAVLPAFLSLRAGVRAMVTGLISAHKARARAREYFDLAVRLLGGGTPRLVAVGGLSGSGKSTLARHLAPHIGRLPGAVILRSDVIRKQLFNVPPEQKLPPENYTRENARRVYDRMMQVMDQALDAGWSVIVDATFQAETSRQDIARRARQRGVGFSGIWLDVPAEVMRERLKGRTGDASDADVRVLEEQLARSTGSVTWPRIPAQGTPGEILKHVLAALH